MIKLLQVLMALCPHTDAGARSGHGNGCFIPARANRLGEEIPGKDRAFPPVR